MNYSDDMPDDIKAILAKLRGSRNIDRCEHGKCDCQQVLNLPPEGKSKLKLFLSDQDKLNRRDRTLANEHHAILAEKSRIKDAFWEFVYETYGLQSTGAYHFTDDGRIMKIEEEH